MMPEYIVLSPPDDLIYCDDELRLSLTSIWEPRVRERQDEWYYWSPIIPTDIIISKTIPLPDFYLRFQSLKTEVHTYIEDGYIAMINDMGVFIYTPKGNGAAWECEMNPGTKHPHKIWNDEEWREDLGALSNLLLEVWYGIQVALLHPQIKIVFQNCKREKLYERTGTGKDRKRTTRYVKAHYLTPEDIKKAMCGDNHKDFKRKTMAWYVIGHWRQYKNGTRKFIKGYWKGPLREMKRNLDGGRVRQLAIQEV